MFARAQQGPSELDWFWRVWGPSQQGPSSTANYASGTHQNPLFSSGDGNPPPLSTSGGTGLSGNPKGETKSVSWSSSKEVQLPSGDTLTLPLQPDVKNTLPPPPGREGYLAKMAALQSPSPHSPQIEYASPHSYFDLPPQPGRNGYVTKAAAQQSPSRGLISDFLRIFNKFGKVKFRPGFRRISNTASSTVDGAQRELQVMVDSGRRSIFTPLFQVIDIPTYDLPQFNG